MPLAALLGPEPAELSRIGGFSPKVPPANTVLIGIRNLDNLEKQQIRDAGVHVFTMKDIDRQGIASIVEQAVNLAANGTAGVHVSFDLDVCDPLIAPGVGTPVKGGLDYREAHMATLRGADISSRRLSRRSARWLRVTANGHELRHRLGSLRSSTRWRSR